MRNCLIIHLIESIAIAVVVVVIIFVIVSVFGILITCVPLSEQSLLIILDYHMTLRLVLELDYICLRLQLITSEPNTCTYHLILNM